MAQQFIVEGNDGYVLSALCEKAGLGLPVGYSERSYRDFVVSAGGIDNITTAIQDALDNRDVTNVGVVVDANAVGIQSRINKVESAIRKAHPGFNGKIELTASGWTIEIQPNLTFGLWVMPNNHDLGYLEHFLIELIAEDDESLALSQRFLTEAKAAGNPKFSEIKEQKVLMALFLALQDEPGMNTQTAVRKGLFNHTHPQAQHFLRWFETTFRLK